MRAGTGTVLIVALLAIGAMLATSFLQPVTWLRVVTDDGTLLACARVDEETPITLAFTHSMFGGYVREVYHLRPDGQLERQRMVTEHAAAAEYYATDGATRQAADGYEVLASPFVTDRLVVRVDARGQHRLTIGDVTHPLWDQLQASTAVTLEGHRGPLHEMPSMCPSRIGISMPAYPRRSGRGYRSSPPIDRRSIHSSFQTPLFTREPREQGHP